MTVPFQHLSLRARITTLMVATALLLLVGCGLLRWWLWERVALAQAESDAVWVSTLASDLLYGELTGGSPETRQQIEATFRADPVVLRLVLRDAVGQIRYSYTHPSDDATADLPPLARRQEDRAATHPTLLSAVHRTLPNGTPVLETVTAAFGPARSGATRPRYLGRVYLRLNLRPTYERRSADLLASLPWLTLLIAGLLAAQLAAISWLLAPLRQTAALASRLVQGERTVPLASPPGQPELSALVGAIAHLLSQTRQAEAAAEAAEARLDQATSAQARAEQRYKALAERAGDAVVNIAPDGGIESTNSRFCQLTGYPPEEIRRRPFVSLVHPDDREEVTARLERWTGGGSTAGQHTFRILTKEREVQHVEGSATAFRQGSQIVGLQLIVRDVTDRRELEGQLLRSQKLESVGRLAGGVAHDFNNLLAAILPSAQLLKLRLKRSEADAPLHDLADQIERVTRRATDLVRQLLSASRVEPVALEPMDFGPVVEEAVRVLHKLVGPQIELRVSLEPGLPRIVGNATKLNQVLLNLGVNARDAMAGRTGTINISVAQVHITEGERPRGGRAVLSPGTYLCLSVGDTGAGIAPEDMAKIFDPFFTTKSIGQGTGLGLFVVFGVVKEHRGEVSVTSEQNSGTTFRVFLPAVGSVAALTGPAPSAPTTEAVVLSHPGGYRTRRILVVDDEPEVAETARRTLELAGYRVGVAHSGIEALERVQRAIDGAADGAVSGSRNELPDLVLLDMRMPQLDGLETFERLRRIAPNLLIVFASGFSQPAQIKAGIAAGANGFIEKPFSIDGLTRTVGRVLPDSVG